MCLSFALEFLLSVFCSVFERKEQRLQRAKILGNRFSTGRIAAGITGASEEKSDLCFPGTSFTVCELVTKCVCFCLNFFSFLSEM